MNVLFADTSYYVALLGESDVHHDAAVRWSRSASRLVLTDCVLLELGASLARSKQRALLPELIRELRSDPLVEIVGLSRALLDAAVDLYRRRPDKEWSLADCVAFVVMRAKDIAEALTADNHFTQAGFKALLR